MKEKFNNILLLIVVVFTLMSCVNFASSRKNPIEEIKIPSSDGLSVQGTLYLTDNTKAPFILLCHRANWSRGEYIEIAPKLMVMGFNCLAIDQRSGRKINGIENITAKMATEKRLNTQYIDVIPDIEAALDYIDNKFNPRKLLLWGSSYSASLSLVISASRPEQVDGVIAFSPGEYFHEQGKSFTWIQDAASKIQVPVFITANNNEAKSVQKIFDALQTNGKKLFIPKSPGKHGSEALFESSPDNEVYWEAIKPFLVDFNQ